MRIFCDFDGTIALCDTTDLILGRFADSGWKSLESAWSAGEISAVDCMRRQIALVRATDNDIDDALDAVKIDPGFGRFVDWSARQGFAPTIVSDGVDRFIGRVLKNHGLGHLPVIANRFSGDQVQRRLSPGLPMGCESGQGVCKCAAVRPSSQPGTPDAVVFVGDGRSDFCVAGQADILFAKGKLLDHVAWRGLPHIPFTSFDDVTSELNLRLQPVHRRETQCLLEKES